MISNNQNLSSHKFLLQEMHYNEPQKTLSSGNKLRLINHRFQMQINESLENLFNFVNHSE